MMSQHMRLSRSRIAIFVFLVWVVFGGQAAGKPIERTDISGTVAYKGTPLCALVLANGVRKFSCNGEGAFHLADVPYDSNGRITLFSFCDGLMPYKTILTEGKEDFAIEMSGRPEGELPVIGINHMAPSIVRPGRVDLAGTISDKFGSPLRALILANGQHVFSTNPPGHFRLTVPVGAGGEIVLFGFCDGLMPRRIVVSDTTRGQVLGPIASATVEVYACGDLRHLVYSTTTTDSKSLSEAGLFDIPVAVLNDDVLYVINVIGGHNLDVDADGVLDDEPLPNLGTLHLTARGADLLNGDFKVSILTEILYQQVAFLMAAQYPLCRIEDTINRFTEVLIKADLNGDGVRDGVDLLDWTPADDKMVLSRDWALFESCLAAVHNNENYFALLNRIFSSTVADGIGGDPVDIAISGSHAYVADRDFGLLVIDISDPAGAHIQGAVEVQFYPVAIGVSNHLACIVTDEDLYVIDINDPTAPFIISSVVLPDDVNGPNDVAIAGSYAFVTNGNSGLLIVDVSTPSAPAVLGDVAIPGAAGVAVAGSVAYVTSYTDRLYWLDIRNPTAPEILGSLETQIPTRSTAIAADGSYVYVPGGLGMQIMDVQDPGNAVVVGSARATGAVMAIDASGQNVYAFCYNTGLQVFDVSTPAEPFLTRHIPCDSDGGCLAVSGRHAYLPRRIGGLQVVDLDYPVVDYDIGRLGAPGEKTLSSRSSIAIRDGRHAYLAGDHLEVIDISDPKAPTIVGSLELAWEIEDIEISENYAFVNYGYGSAQESVDIIDVRVPQAPLRIGPMPTSMRGVAVVQAMAVSGSYVYAANLYPSFDRYGSPTYDVSVVDVKNPYAPKVVTWLGVTGGTGDMAVCGNYVYQEGTRSLRILDVGDPLNPFIANDLQLPEHYGRRITFANGYAYVTGDTGFQIFDAGDPEFPTLAGAVENLDVIPTGNIEICDGHAFLKAYVPDGGNAYCVLAVDVSDPGHPKTPLYVNLIDGVSDIAATDENIYALDQTGRLHVLRKIAQ